MTDAAIIPIINKSMVCNLLSSYVCHRQRIGYGTCRMSAGDLCSPSSLPETCQVQCEGKSKVCHGFSASDWPIWCERRQKGASFV